MLSCGYFHNFIVKFHMFDTNLLKLGVRTVNNHFMNE